MRSSALLPRYLDTGDSEGLMVLLAMDHHRNIAPLNLFDNVLVGQTHTLPGISQTTLTSARARGPAISSA